MISLWLLFPPFPSSFPPSSFLLSSFLTSTFHIHPSPIFRLLYFRLSRSQKLSLLTHFENNDMSERIGQEWCLACVSRLAQTCLDKPDTSHRCKGNLENMQ